MQLRAFVRGLMCGVLCCGGSTVQASYFPTTVSSPDNSARFVSLEKNQWYALSLLYEDGQAGTGYDDASNRKSFGSMYNNNGESFLAMLRNGRDDVRTKLQALDHRLLVAPDYGGKRGFVDIAGKIYHKQLTLGSAVNLRLIKWIPGFFDASFYMPFVSKKFDGISMTRRSSDRFDADDALLDDQMKDISGFLKNFGNLSAEPWADKGIGDPTLVVRWNMPYEKQDSEIRVIQAHVHCGVQIPLAKKKNEDQLFSLPLGCDGLWGFPFGVGVEMKFSMPVKIGMGADFLLQLAESRERRVKTALKQTDLFLLNKARTLLRPGLTWRFHWAAEGYNLWRGLGVRGMYEFLMHHNDQLSTTAEGYRTETVGTSNLYKKWYAHALTAAIRYDLGKEFSKAPMTPRVEAYVRAPVNGKRFVNATVLGLQIAVLF